ncbi:MAG: HlyD family efflux transporter periplasmic adaptor subunit [Bacteroidetes bacterium]|nr:HlyD family efflux transporter periplasmic adaptor subunit [Bacteroidota bacterium]
MSTNNNIGLSTESLQSANVNNRFSERSDEAQEIINQKQDFIEKWALAIFLFILLLGLSGTWFFRYPDIIEANAVLTGFDAPTEIIPLQAGRLTKLFVHNNQQLHKGDMLAWIESDADTQEVLDLSEELHYGAKLLSTGKSLNVSKIFSLKFRNLGELQTAYHNFCASLQQFNDYKTNGFYAKRKILLYRDIFYFENIGKKIEEQKSQTESNNGLRSKTFDMNDHLLKREDISFDDNQSTKMTIPQLDANIISYKIQISERQKELDQLNHDFLQQKNILEQALLALKSSVDDWILKYTLQAPMDGIVVFAMPVQQNQFIEKGKLLGLINPQVAKFYAEIKLSQNIYSKVDTGMQVQLRFDAYPYQEVGFVKGTLNYISTIDVDSGFLGTIRLDNGLITNQNRKIQYKKGLKAQAIIITKNMRLLQRLYYNLFRSISPQK